MADKIPVFLSLLLGVVLEEIVGNELDWLSGSTQGRVRIKNRVIT
jgi:hypothetical protein